MNIDTLYQLRSDAFNELKAGRLLQALSIIEGMAYSINDWDVNDEIESIRSGYGLLLDYMAKGVNDPDRNRLLDSFERRSTEVTDKICHLAEMRESSRLQTRLYHQIEGEALSFHSLTVAINAKADELLTSKLDTGEQGEQRSAALYKDLLELYAKLFKQQLTSPRWTQGDADEVAAYFSEPLNGIEDQSLLVSAIMLNCLSYFDYRKLQLLLTLTSDSNALPAIKERALVGAVFVTMALGDNYKFYPEIKAQYALLTDDPSFTSRMLSLQLQLIIILETREIQRQIQEEIIPTFMNNPGFKLQKFGLEDIDSIMSHAEEGNPDWEKSEEMKKVTDKLGKMAEMQSAGADIYMNAFSQMKYFPFFSEISNWFYPFDDAHPALSSLRTLEMQTVRSFLRNDFLCDSDRYSFALMLQSSGAKNISLMLEGIKSAIPEDDTFERLSPTHQSTDTLRRFYLQDLYRFFTLHSNRQDFNNPYGREIMFLKYPLLRQFINDEESLLQIAEFALKQKQYQWATDCYALLDDSSTLNADHLQKFGYACQKINDIERAILVYEKSDLLKPHSLWTMRHLAQCYRMMDANENAIKYYKEIELIEPDNLQVLYHHGECLVSEGEYEEAFAIFFKVEYLDKHPERSQRAIAWCSFITNKLGQAEKYYRKLLASPSPKPQDYLNAGHVAWAQGNVPEAITCYSTYRDARPDFDGSAIMNDAIELSHYGITATDIHLMTEILLRK